MILLDFSQTVIGSYMGVAHGASEVDEDIFSHIDYFTPNETEASFYVNHKIVNEQDAKKASEKLNPRKIGSEKISLIFDKRISKGVLKTLASSIVASSIARGTSFLKNKLDQEIFSKEINVIDKPDILKGLGSMPFDSEGVQSKELKIIENGILKNYLIDTYNGKKLNLSSNGRSGGTTNIYFEKGKTSYFQK